MAIGRVKHHHAAFTACTVLVLGVAACGTGGSGTSGGGSLKTGPGIDANAKTITVGIESPLSGPVAVIGKPLTEGQEAYFKHVNDSGGISGWKINYVEKDDGYDPQKHVQLFNELLPNMAMLAQSLGSPTTAAISQLAASQNLVVGAAAQSSAFVTQKVMAVIGTPYAIDVANGIDYVVKTLGKSNATFSIFYQNDDYGQDGIKGYEAALASDHFTDLGRVSYNATDTDFTAQATQLKKLGAQYVVVTAIPGAAAKLVGTAAVLGYTPQWIFQGPAWSEYLMTSDGTPNGTKTPVYPVLAAGVWVLGYEAAWGDTSVPGMQQFLADHDKYFPQQPPDGYYMYGYCEAEMEVAILKKAIAANDLSRQGILDAKLNLGGVDFGGLIPSLTYTPQLGPADRETDIAQVSASSPGFLKVIQPYFTSDAAKNMTFGS